MTRKASRPRSFATFTCANWASVSGYPTYAAADGRSEDLRMLADIIVTHNVRDFAEAARFGIRILRPGALLRGLGIQP